MHHQENTADTQTAPDEPGLDASTWFAPFNSAAFLSLQAAIGNRAVSQLLQTDAMQPGHQNNGNGHSQFGTALAPQECSGAPARP